MSIEAEWPARPKPSWHIRFEKGNAAEGDVPAAIAWVRSRTGAELSHDKDVRSAVSPNMQVLLYCMVCRFSSRFFYLYARLGASMKRRVYETV